MVLTKKTLIKDLRDALTHLHDPVHLRQNPLVRMLLASPDTDTPAALRRILIGLVASLKPEPDEPPQSPAWRYYESLYYRYVQRFSQIEVANQIGLSDRQLRRDQNTGLEILADRIIEQYASNLVEMQDLNDNPTSSLGSDKEQKDQEDLARLVDPESGNVAFDIQLELTKIITLIQPLAQKYNIQLILHSADRLPPVSASSVIVRQAILSLLGMVIPAAAPGSPLQMAAIPSDAVLEITIRIHKKSRQGPPEIYASDMISNLVQRCAAKLDVFNTEDMLQIGLLLPVQYKYMVMVIDDNPGIIRLFERYVEETRYQVLAVHDLEKTFEWAAKTPPDLILLDVMMPGLDGWEVLGRLKHHPATSQTPVIVCTILGQQEELAYTLGADGFLQKPVTRQAFLSALDQQIAR